MRSSKVVHFCALAIGAMLMMPMGDGAFAQTTVSFTGPPANIPDAFPSGVARSVAVSGLGVVTDIDVRFDALPGCDATVDNPNAAITHSFVGDLIIKLTSPGGSEVILFNRRGGTRENFCETLLDDDGGFPALSTLSSATGQTVAGSFAPDASLSAFDGQSPNGSWVLNISDNAGSDTGTLNRFSLILHTAPIEQIVVDLFDDPFPGGCAPGSCSLREAVNLANARPGLDRILLPVGTVQLTRPGAGEDANLNGDLDIGDEVEIIGISAAQTTVTQTSADRLLHTTGTAATLILRNLKLLGGNGVDDGGALFVGNGAKLMIEDAELNGHRAQKKGGAIYHSGGALASGPRVQLRRVSFNDNRATNSTADNAYGGAMYSISSGFSDPYMLIEDCVLTNNRADNGAGALALDGVQSVSGNYVQISGSTLSQNLVSLGGRGGAIATEVEGNGLVRLRIADSIFSLNTVPSSVIGSAGGAISAGGSEMVSISRSLFEQNSARAGGAIDGAAGDITDSTFCNNTALESAGALRLTGFETAIRRSTLCNNTVTTADTSQFGGGAIAVPMADLTIERSTLDGNSAVRGAAIAIGGGDLFLRSNTIVAPSPLPAGALGSVLRYSGTLSGDALSLVNNILIGQCSYVSAGIVPDGAFNNIEASGNTCRLLTAALQAGNQTAVSGTSINLGSLTGNGGPTDTRLPMTPSIAINAASQIACTFLDQRGYQRTDGSCDIGSVEASGQAPPDSLFANGFE